MDKYLVETTKPVVPVTEVPVTQVPVTKASVKKVPVTQVSRKRKRKAPAPVEKKAKKKRKEKSDGEVHTSQHTIKTVRQLETLFNNTKKLFLTGRLQTFQVIHNWTELATAWANRTQTFEELFDGSDPDKEKKHYDRVHKKLKTTAKCKKCKGKGIMKCSTCKNHKKPGYRACHFGAYYKRCYDCGGTKKEICHSCDNGINLKEGRNEALGKDEQGPNGFIGTFFKKATPETCQKIYEQAIENIPVPDAKAKHELETQSGFCGLF